MKFIPIEKIPKKCRRIATKKNVYKMLSDFMDSPAKIVKVKLDTDDYLIPFVCKKSIEYVVSKYDFSIKTHFVDNQVYLEKV